jgi:PAS domain S-box-containing protein
MRGAAFSRGRVACEGEGPKGWNEVENQTAEVESGIPFHLVAELTNQVLYMRDVKAGRAVYVNAAYETIWRRSRQSLLDDPNSFLEAVHPDDRAGILAAMERQHQGHKTQEEYRVLQPDGGERWILDRCYPLLDSSGRADRVVGIAEDITERKQTEAALREQTQMLEHVLRAGQVIGAELDLNRLVQAVTDAARELCGAQFGAFFYNVTDPQGERYTLYTLSGAPREAFAAYPMPRATQLFGPTFRAEGTIRLDDVHADERYGHMAPHFGMPKGHLPVTSYLAVPVVSRSGETLGGLFFGHDAPGVFTPSRARMVEHLAAQAAVAIDNARLFEMVQHERALARASQQDYQFLAEAIPQIVWVSGSDGVVSYFNQRWNDYTGQNIRESHEWNWQSAMHPDDVEPTLERWAQALRHGEAFTAECRLRRASDGSYRWHLARAVPLRDEEGQVVKWFGTSTDIDEQKRSHEGLRFLSDAGAILSASLDPEQTVRTLVELAVPDLADWCVVDVVESGTLKRMAVAHQEPEKVRLGFELFERYPPCPEDPASTYAVMRSGQPHLIETIPPEMLEAAARDDEMLQLLRGLGLISSMVVPLHAHGHTLGVMTLVSSHSGRHFGPADLMLAEELARRAGEAVHNARLYREVQDALQKAKEAMRARDEFLAIVSHELKTPLTPILGWVSMLQSARVHDSGTIEHALGVIERNVRSQSQLINDLLDVSRIVTGKLRLDARAIDLGPVIEAALETVRPAALAKGIELRASLATVSTHIQGDPDRLQQIVWNLVSNAIKFTPKGGVVLVGLERIDSSLEISVRDTGQGIEERFLPYIFDRFQQADSSTTRVHGGLGLGLSIVRHLVEMHGGTVVVESPGKGQGSTFRVRLPLLAVKHTSSTAPTPSKEGAEAEDSLGSFSAQAPRALLEKLRVLVVEDEADAREMIAASLQSYGAQVRLAVSAREGFEALREWRPDIVVSDIGMPTEDGYSLLARVRALPPEDGGRTPAIALTAYARMEDRLKALSAGFQNHVAKPVDPAELALTIASALGLVSEPHSK